MLLVHSKVDEKLGEACSASADCGDAEVIFVLAFCIISGSGSLFNLFFTNKVSSF